MTLFTTERDTKSKILKKELEEMKEEGDKVDNGEKIFDDVNGHSASKRKLTEECHQ